MENTLNTESFYNEIEDLIKPLNLCLVEASVYTNASEGHVSIYGSKEGGATSDDLDSVYELVYLKLKSRFKGLNLEVSTPGCTRKIKDAGEFKFFKGNSVRVYSEKENAWMCGIIKDADDTQLFLSASYKEDGGDDISDSTILFRDIKKARLIDATLQKEKAKNGKEDNKKH